MTYVSAGGLCYVRVHNVDPCFGSRGSDKASSSSAPWEVVVSPSLPDAPSPSASLGDSNIYVEAAPASYSVYRRAIILDMLSRC